MSWNLRDMFWISLYDPSPRFWPPYEKKCEQIAAKMHDNISFLKKIVQANEKPCTTLFHAWKKSYAQSNCIKLIYIVKNNLYFIIPPCIHLYTQIIKNITTHQIMSNPPYAFASLVDNISTDFNHCVHTHKFGKSLIKWKAALSFILIKNPYACVSKIHNWLNYCANRENMKKSIAKFDSVAVKHGLSMVIKHPIFTDIYKVFQKRH